MFDINGDGDIEAEEILQTMKGLGFPITLEKAKDMIASVDIDKNGKIDIQEFEELMKPILLDKLLASEDNLEATRALFREADVDYSGFLTADEVWNVLIKQGVDIGFEELCELMDEFDMDGNMGLDIDEFVAMMNLGEDATFENENAQETFLKVRKVNKLSIMDFVKAFGHLPASFVPSTFTDVWK